MATTNPVYYLEFPEENARTDSEYSFTYEDDEDSCEPAELALADVRKLNQLAVAFVKFHTGTPNLRQMLAHRRLAERLVWELFPANWEQLEPSFEYDEELADGARDYLHLLYFKMPEFTQIALHSLRLQRLAMTDKEVANTRRMTLLRLASLFPNYLMKKQY